LLPEGLVKPDVVVDVGNTRIKWGRCAADRVLDSASLPHDDEAAWQGQMDLWQIGPDSTWLLSGVRPSQRDKLREWLERQEQRTAVLDSYRQLPLRVNVDYPEKVGLDRLLNAVAVNSERSADAAAIIIDAGTAVTVDYVDAAGTFQGGAIFPGLRLMAKALHDYTALLPLIDVFQPRPMPAKNTDAALRTGIFAATLGGIESLAERLSASSAAPTQWFLAGGDASLLAPHLKGPVRVWPEMTLEGIRCCTLTL
jgi:type III pantothenate kinase